MSARNLNKRMRRSAAKAGFGRGMGNVAALVAMIQNRDQQEKERRVNIQRIKAERRISKASAIDKMVEQEQKRKRQNTRFTTPKASTDADQ